MDSSQKNIIIGSGIVVLLIIGLFVYSRSVSDGAEEPVKIFSGVTLSAEKTFYDFGTVSMAKGPVTTSFKLKNQDGGDIVVKKIYTSCMCTNALFIHGATREGPFGMQGHGFISSIDETIRPGEEADVEVTFDPSAHGPAGVGRIERTVTVEQKGQSPLNLTIRAMVTP